jgi:iron(III) transport system ATP-binding protein
MTDPLWQLTDVRLGPATRPRLAEVTATIPPGITAVLGESGAGKTSLLNLLVEFERPDGGRVVFHPPTGREEGGWGNEERSGRGEEGPRGRGDEDAHGLMANPQSSMTNSVERSALSDESRENAQPSTLNPERSMIDQDSSSGIDPSHLPSSPLPLCPSARLPLAPLPLAWVPADSGLWPFLSVREHLAAVLPTGNGTGWNAGSGDEPGGDETPRSAGEWLDAFDLGHVADQRPETLSMGERARLSVARALASAAAVQVMDEPLVHVDVGRSSRYWRILRETLARRGSSLVFSSHAPETVIREADRVLCIADGRIRWQGAVETLYHDPPDEQTARFLGPVNWFSPEEAAIWLNRWDEGPLSLRPERITVTPDPEGRFLIEESRFAGSIAETDLHDPNQGTRRTIVHRPPIRRFAPGTRVALHLPLTCLLLCLCLLMPGCPESAGEEPRIRVGEPRVYSLPAEGASLPAPRGMTFSPEGELYVLDTAGRVIVYDAGGEFARRWWMPKYEIGKPEGAWVLRDGRIAVADTHYHRVLFFNRQGEVLDELGTFGREEGEFIYTVAVTQDPEGFLYVAEYGGNDRIQKFTAGGEHVVTFGAMGTEPGEFQRPSGIVWHEGIVYVADAINNRIQAFREDGEFVSIVADAESAGLYYPYDLALGPDETLYVAEYGAGRISRISLEGKVLGRYGREGRDVGEFWTPWGIAVSREGKIAVADTGNRRVVELLP